MSFEAVQKFPRYRLDLPVDVVTPAAVVERLPLENISLGGVFIKTTTPAPAGSLVRMRLASTDVTLGLMGRVVHVIDVEAAKRKAHPPGMGVQFEGLSTETQASLEKFVAGVVFAYNATQRTGKIKKAAAKFAPPSVVLLSLDRASIQQLLDDGLMKGALYVESDTLPPLGARIGIAVGSLSLQGDVVHVNATSSAHHERGFGVQVLDLTGNKLDALVRYANGSAHNIVVDEIHFSGPPLGKVLAAARRMFVGIEENDPFGGIGLTQTATADEVQKRCDGLVRLFQVQRPDASPPQQARIDAACRAVGKLESVLLTRVTAMRQQAELATVRTHEVTDKVRDLIQEALRAEQSNDKHNARRVLLKALELAPEDEAVKHKLGSVTKAIDLAQAADLVKSATDMVSVMKEEAVKRAREAARLTDQREVRLMAVRVLAKAGEADDAILLAEELVELDPKDALAWQALFLLHERRKDWRSAARAGEALLRLKPDADLKKRVAKIVAEMRR